MYATLCYDVLEDDVAEGAVSDKLCRMLDDNLFNARFFLTKMKDAILNYLTPCFLLQTHSDVLHLDDEVPRAGQEGG